MSAASRPEVFLDRSLGRVTGSRLSAAGWVVHHIADHYAHDAQATPDERWIADGCAAGWVLLSKDRHIRFRARELAALHDGILFCLSNGSLRIDEMVDRFLAAEPHIVHAALADNPGFWHVYAHGQVRRMWP